MKRLRRIIFNNLAVLSFTLCVLTVALWVWSYTEELVIDRSGPWGQSGVIASRGLLFGIRERTVYPHARDSYEEAGTCHFESPARSADRFAPPWSVWHRYGKVYVNWGGLKYGSGERGGSF